MTDPVLTVLDILRMYGLSDSIAQTIYTLYHLMSRYILGYCPSRVVLPVMSIPPWDQH